VYPHVRPTCLKAALFALMLLNELQAGVKTCQWWSGNTNKGDHRQFMSAAAIILTASLAFCIGTGLPKYPACCKHCVLFCIGLKLGLSRQEENIGWGFLRFW